MKRMGKVILSIFIIIVVLVICTVLYSHYIGVKGLQVKEYKVTNKIVPTHFHGFKIVHMSDIHYGNTINIEDLQKIVDKINFIHPDIVVITGDLFDKKIDLEISERKKISNVLASISVTTGKYAITGENDTQYVEWENVITEGGFTNLNNTYQFIYKEDYTPIIISGMDSNIKAKKSISDKTSTSREAIDTYNKEHPDPIYSILLMHEPDYVEQIEAKYYNLILAGHSHGGQINIPLIKQFIIPKGAKKYNEDHHMIKGNDLYISSGIGTTDLTYRLLNKPSINFYRLTNK